MGILMSSIFSYLRITSTIQQKIVGAERQILSRAQLQNRLDQIFSQLVPKEENQTNFYLDNRGTLHFCFDNVIDFDKTFSGLLNGKLYIDRQQLILEISPLCEEKNAPLRREVLFTPLEKFSIEFYENFREKPENVWPKENNAFPAAIKLIVETTAEPIVFAFFTMDHQFEGIKFKE